MVDSKRNGGVTAHHKPEGERTKNPNARYEIDSSLQVMAMKDMRDLNRDNVFPW